MKGNTGKKQTKTCYVTVLRKDGTPAAPTTRCAHVRILLKEGKAVAVRTRPFTIRLLYDIEGTPKDEVLGVDPGRTNIGIASVREDGTCTLKEHVTTRNKDIHGLMVKRAEFRRKHRDMGRRDVRQRRAKAHGTVTGNEGGVITRLLPGNKEPITCKLIKNKKARYNNRKRGEKWLTPTARQLLETHLSAIGNAVKQRPVKRIVIEANRFAFMTLDNPGVKWEDINFEEGPLYGYGSLHDAVSDQQGGHCLMCGGKIRHYHHIVPRNSCGSDTIGNIAGLCGECHDRVHKDSAFVKEVRNAKAGMKKKYAGASVLNQVIPFLIDELEKRYPDIEVCLTTGRKTKNFRDSHGIQKGHDNDAYCIACSSLGKAGNTGSAGMAATQEIMQFRRQDRMACHKEMPDREYVDETGKTACRNRHKRTEQKCGSLEEYRQRHTERAVSCLAVKEHRPQYKDMGRVMPGAVICFTPIPAKKDGKAGNGDHHDVFVLKRTDGKNNGTPNYLIGTNKKRYPFSRCKVLRQNTGLVYL